MKQVFDVAQGKRVPDIQHNGQTDYFCRRVEVSEKVRRGHRLRLSALSVATTGFPLTMPFSVVRTVSATPSPTTFESCLQAWEALGQLLQRKLQFLGLRPRYSATFSVIGRGV